MKPLLTRRLSRRKLLALGGATLAGSLLDRVAAQTPQASELIRIGVVLPTRTGLTPVRAAAYQVAGDAAKRGAVMAEEEFGFNAELLGKRLEVRVATGPDNDAVLRAAERLTSAEEVFALIGGYGAEASAALSDLAEARRIPYFNIGSPSDALRGEGCRRHTFHVEASAAMYLDALVAWFIRSAFRRWYVVYPDSATGNALVERARTSLNDRHFGGEEVGSTALAPDQQNFSEVLREVRAAEPEVVLLLLDPVAQLDFLGQYDVATSRGGLEAQVAGFPDPVTQTRTFYAASVNTAPRAGTGYRASLWEARLDAYGARELNQRFLERWGTPMDGPAWAAYQSVKMLYEAAAFTNSLESADILGYLEDPQTTFDVHKGIGVSFRPWDHQLRQPLYLVKLNPDAERAWGLASLVGELPALYMPDTDPVERLDQLGDLARASGCRF